MGFWSRGYHGDCRDCIHYKHCYHYIDKNEWHCSYSGEDFEDEYGDQCHFFYDIEQQRLEQEREAHKYDFIAGMAFFSQCNDEEDEQDKREIPCKTESNDGSENILYVILICLMILYGIYKFFPWFFSLIFYTVLILIFSLYSSIFSGNIRTKLFKSFIISIIINIFIEVFESW